MAKPTKKTLEEIAAENNIDISEENAQTVANNYIQPTIDAINQAEQKAIADTQAARKALENNYFKQYRNSMYNAQSRGLTGGLANMDTAQLRMQMGQANADLSKDLITAQTNAETNRGTALTTAENYKEDYLQKMMDKVIALRDKDYSERYAEWQYAEQLAQAERDRQEELRRWNLQYQMSLDRYNMEKDQFEYEKSLRDTNKKQADLQYAANVQEYLNMVLPDVANTYISYMKSGDMNTAADYLGRTAAQLNKEYGANMNDVIRQVTSVYQHGLNKDQLTNYTNLVKAQRNQNIANSVLGGALGLGWGAVTGGLALPTLIPTAISTAAGAVGGGATTGLLGGFSAYDKYKTELEKYNNKVNNAYLPSWYVQ